MIANPLGGVVEYAREGETAWLNQSRSGSGLAALMLRLIREPGLVHEMHGRVVAARDRILGSGTQHVDAIEDACRELCSAS